MVGPVPLAWERGPGWKCRWNHHRKRKGQEGAGVTADHVQWLQSCWYRLRAQSSGCRELSFTFLFLCKTTVSELGTPSGDFRALRCCDIVKGSQVETEPPQGPPVFPGGRRPVRAPASQPSPGSSCPQDWLLVPTSCRSEAQAPASWLQPPGPGFWDSLGVSKTLTLLCLPGVRTSKNLHLADCAGLSVSSRYRGKMW